MGKSTLLNTLLNEERAIVSEIAGTTRDSIEDEITIGGIGFRFIDTAGIRDTVDTIERIGIQRTFEKIAQAQVVVYLVDATTSASEEGNLPMSLISEIGKIREAHPHKPLIAVVNKTDLVEPKTVLRIQEPLAGIDGISVQMLSAKKGSGVEELKKKLLALVHNGALGRNETIVTNSRHYDALLKALEEIQKVQAGMEAGVSGDLLSIDIRQALYHFGEITGEITSDDLLGNIFANFCIGK